MVGGGRLCRGHVEQWRPHLLTSGNSGIGHFRPLTAIHVIDVVMDVVLGVKVEPSVKYFWV